MTGGKPKSNNMYLEMRLDRADENGKIISVSRRIPVRSIESFVRRKELLDTIYDNLMKESLLKETEETEE